MRRHRQTRRQAIEEFINQLIVSRRGFSVGIVSGRHLCPKTEEIQADEELARTVTWYSPEKIIEILISQKGDEDPAKLIQHLDGFDVGDWTLVITCEGRTQGVTDTDRGPIGYGYVALCSNRHSSPRMGNFRSLKCIAIRKLLIVQKN